MAVAVVRPAPRARRYGKQLLLLGLAVLIAASAGMALMFAWVSSDAAKTEFNLGSTDDYKIGSVTRVTDGKFYLVRASETEFVALSWRDPHSHCTVPWRPTFSWPDADGSLMTGWFRDPCSGDTYDKTGHKVFGPSTQDMDRYAVMFIRGDHASERYASGYSVIVDKSLHICGSGPPVANYCIVQSPVSP